ncbi:MAG: hypothetical protein M3R02_03800 [Chloroflexota bacterium]|nr:hypothetical protein [Chloroflexota bacterium]
MTDATAELISTGGLAQRLGCSISLLKKLDATGQIAAPALRIEGSGRRVWRADDLPALERQVDELLRGNGRRKVRTVR